MKKYLPSYPTAAALFVAFVFIQSLFFKFAGVIGEPADITVYIFTTVGTWIESLGLVAIGTLFSSYGELAIGLLEFIASILILVSATRIYGALLGFGIISGAIFFHIFTPLGLFPYTDLNCLTAGCPQEYPLFFMAIGVWLCCSYLIIKHFKTPTAQA